MRHIIHKQVLQLAIGPGLEAFAVQHAASRFLQDVLTPVLERVFDELAGEEEVICIDRLVLDLGLFGEWQLSRGAMDRELYELLKGAIQRALADEGGAAAVQRMSRQASVLAQWWYYMEKGRLPWNADIVDEDWYRRVLEYLATDYAAVSRLRQALDQNPVFLQRLCQQHTDRFLETLAGILTGAKQTGLHQQLEDCIVLSRRLEILVQETGDAGQEEKKGGTERPRQKKGQGLPEGSAFSGILQRWKEDHTAFLAVAQAHRKAVLWGLVLREAALRPGHAQREGMLSILSKWLSRDRRIYSLLRSLEPGLPLHSFEGKDLLPHLPGNALVGGTDEKGGDAKPVSPGIAKEERASAKGKQEDIGNPEPAIPQGRSASEKAARLGTKDEGTMAKDPVPEQVEEQEQGWRVLSPEEEPALSGAVETSRRLAEEASGNGDIGEEGLFGKHAGLILLHPFLPAFFSQAGVWAEGGFVSPEAWQQAVFLLYYLATGGKEAPEYELILPKFLCGYRLEEPIPDRLDIAPEVYAEADHLLENVLQHWEKLKDSSIGALREGFLQRPGKLASRGERTVLLVETSAIDVLLDFLPWNLSIVKLPWMKQLLSVEWR
jgi:hypothetical protein